MKNNSYILEFHNQLLNKKSLSSLLKPYLEINAQHLENNDNVVLYDFSQNVKHYSELLENKLKNNFELLNNHMLFGIPCSLKDNICTKGFKTTGGSKFLEHYIPPFNATVVKKLYNDYVVFVNKSNLDEFGLGGTGTFSAYGIVQNPFDKTRIAGGSSSGSAVSVAKGSSIFAIGTDTGDSIRKPASYLGIVGYKPSYGLVSRYGVFPYAPSFDHVGVLSKTVIDTAIVLDSIVAYDTKDFSSVKIEKNFYQNLNPKNKVKVLILDDVNSGLKPEYQKPFNDLFVMLKNHPDFTVKHDNFNMELLKIIDPLYQALSYSEAASSWNNLNGILFGNTDNIQFNNYDELIHRIRSQYLGSQLKKRFVVGNYCTSNENFDRIYLKSRRLIEIIRMRAKELLQDTDVIIMPGASDIAFKVDDVLNNKTSTNYCDDALQIANFAGLPSITIPFYTHDDKKNFIGLNIWSDMYKDQTVLNVALKLENYLKGIKNE